MSVRSPLPDTATSPRARLSRFWSARHQRLTPIATLLVAVAISATSLHRSGFWYADFRYEHNANPGQWAMRMGSVWDTTRGFGTFRSEIWPAPTAFFGPLRAAGLSMAWSQNLFHAALLALLGIGVVVLLREWHHRIGWMHLSAALFAMLAPFSVAFMLPSGLFISYALLPWILVLIRRGIMGSPLYWSALLVLVVAAFGSVDRGGLVFSAIAGVVLIATTIHGEAAATWRSTWAWAWRVTVLAVPTLAAVTVGLALAAEVTAQDLRETELATFVNSASSWPESWRGLGFWQVYLRDFSGWAKPQTLWYSTSPVAYASTFAAPLVAMVGLAVASKRQRLVFGSLLAVGLVLMVGTHPVGDPSPYGRLLRWLYDAVPASQVLRNSYKAGAIATLATAMLFGVAVDHGVERWRRRRPGARRIDIVGVAALVLIAAIAFPVWTRGFNADARGFDDLPEYVPEAMAWLDDQPDDSRVLFVPGAVRNGFRWGDVNDDVLDDMVDRPHLIDVAIHTSRPVAADILSAIDDTLADDRYQPGWAAALGARFGIEYLVIRNDIDWQVWGQARPIAYQPLRDDPATTLVASFGEPGEFTTDPADESGDAEAEAELPPIEIYRISDVDSQVTSRAPAPPIIVSGDGDAFPLLFGADLLPAERATVFSGSLTPPRLEDAVRSGAPVVITDTNRRVAEYITQSPQRSHTLAAGQVTDRDVHELFDAAGAETTAVYGDVASIEASTSVATGDAAPWHRPALALDDSEETSWLVGGLRDPVGERFRLRLREDAGPVEGIEIIATEPTLAGDRRIRAVLVRTSDGDETALELVDGAVQLDWPARRLAWVEVEITIVDGLGLGPVGFSTIDLAGIDEAERLRVPDDILRAADLRTSLAAALDDADIAYVFGRLRGSGPVDEERSLRRDFRSPARDGLDLHGTMALGGTISDEVLATIEGREISAVGSARFRGLVRFRGNAAVDGDLRSAWSADNRDTASLDLRFPARVVDVVRVHLRHGSGLARPSAITVRTGDETLATATLEPPVCPTDQCRETITLPLADPGTSLDSLSIVFEALGPGDGEQPIRIDEVDFGTLWAPSPPGDAATCVDDLLSLDGVGVPVGFPDGSGALFDEEPVAYRACSSISLTSGWHRLAAGPGVLVDTATIAPPDLAGRLAVEAPPLGLEPTQTGATEWTIAVDGDAPTLISLGQSWHPGWRAAVGGQDLGEPIPIDGLAGWLVPAGQNRSIDVDFAPQTVFELSWVISLVALVAVVGIAATRRPGALPVSSASPWPLGGDASDEGPATRAPATIGVTAASVLVAYLIGGLSGLAVGGLALVIAWTTARPSARLAALGAAALGVAATTGLVGHQFGESTFGPAFAVDPAATADWGRHAGILLTISVLWSALQRDPAPAGPENTSLASIGPIDRWRDAALTAGFAAAFAAVVAHDGGERLVEVTRAFALGHGARGARELDLLGLGPAAPAISTIFPFASALVTPIAAGVAAWCLLLLLGRTRPSVDHRLRMLATVGFTTAAATAGPAWIIAAALVAAGAVALVDASRDVAAGLAFGAAALTHAVTVPIAILIVIATTARRPEQRRRGMVVLAVTGLCWLPWLLWRARNG